MPAKKTASKKRKTAKASRKKVGKKKTPSSKKPAGKKRKVSKKSAVTKKAAKAKKSTKKSASRKVSAAKKKPAKKASGKKTASKKKPARKKVSRKKPAAKKKASKKKASKKVAAKKASAKKASARKPSGKKPATRKTTGSKHSRKKAATQKSAVRPTKRARPTGKSSAVMAKRTRGDVLSGPIHGVEPYVASRGEEYMSAEQLDHFKSILMAWKRELMDEVDRTVHHMQDEAANFPDPNDRATQESEFGLELRTRDRERKLLRKINAALTRIDEGTYGYCEETGEEIGLKRLEARPVATLSLEAQERREMAERQFRDRDDRYR